MITYQVVQPFFYTLSANTVNEAIKNFVKIHHDLNLNNIIITDQTKNYKANFKYFHQDGRNKVGINLCRWSFSKKLSYSFKLKNFNFLFF